MTLERARQMALALPQVEERPSHGVPTFRIGGKIFAAMREELKAIVLKIGFDERDGLVASDPEVFFFTDHYKNYPYVLARLSKIPSAELRELLEDCWRSAAPRRLLAELDPD